jgi:hypothetical protein
VSRFQLSWSGSSAQLTSGVSRAAAATVAALMVLPGVQLLVRGFLAAINVAIVMQRGITPSVTEPMELKVAGEDFIRPVNGQAGANLKVDQLFGVLRGEPATWRGVNQNGGQWGWDLTDIRLSRYVGVRDGQDYLARLKEAVGLSQVVPSAAILGPMALPDAFDHLDLAWRLLTGEHLVRVPRAAMAAKLAELLGDKAGRAQGAVDTLRLVVALRAGQQHQGADKRAEQAKVALGLASFAGDWPGAWKSPAGGDRPSPRHYPRGDWQPDARRWVVTLSIPRPRA